LPSGKGLQNRSTWSVRKITTSAGERAFCHLVLADHFGRDFRRAGQICGFMVPTRERTSIAGSFAGEFSDLNDAAVQSEFPWGMPPVWKAPSGPAK
jgi:hypothetical protein